MLPLSSPFQLWFELCALFSKEACRHKSIEFDFIKVIDEKKSTKKVLKAYMDAIAGYLKCIADDVANEEKKKTRK